MIKNTKFMEIMRIKLKLSIILIILVMLSPTSSGKEDSCLVFQYINNKNWVEAERIAKSSKNTALLKIVLSQKFLDSNYKKNSFEEIVKFLEVNTHWPLSNKLKDVAESLLNDATNKKIILKWFEKHKPKSPAGHKFYALAAADLGTEASLLTNLIKNGWIYGDFSKFEEQVYLKRFKKYLTGEDHVKRVDEQLWRSDIPEARRSMYLVSDAYKQAFEAEIAAIQNSISKEALFNKIPEQYYTSGLLFNYLKSKKKKRRMLRVSNYLKK